MAIQKITKTDKLRAMEYVDELIATYFAAEESARARARVEGITDTERANLDNEIAGLAAVSARLRHVRSVVEESLARKPRRSRRDQRA